MRREKKRNDKKSIRVESAMHMFQVDDVTVTV